MDKKGLYLPVVEEFYSLQGEGYIPKPQVMKQVLPDRVITSAAVSATL